MFQNDSYGTFEIFDELIKLLLSGEKIEEKSIKEMALKVIKDSLNSKDEEIKFRALELVFKYDL